MKNIALILSGLLTGTAGASPPDSDTAVDASTPQATSPYQWTGWHVGGNVGFSWGSSDISYVQDKFSVFGFDFVRSDSEFGLTGKLKPKSGVAGVQGGYDYQRGPLVLGFIADFDYRSGSDKAVIGPLFPELHDFLSVSTTHEWLGTMRIRVGLEPCKACLIYATGGLAYGRVVHAIVQTSVEIDDRSFDSLRAFSDSQTRVGWTAGAGLEYRIDEKWSLGVEYLYVDLGSDSIEVGASSGNGPPAITLFYPATKVSFENTSSMARMMLNYRFSGP